MKCQHVTSEMWWTVGRSLRTVLSQDSMSMSVLLLNEHPVDREYSRGIVTNFRRKDPTSQSLFALIKE